MIALMFYRVRHCISAFGCWKHSEGRFCRYANSTNLVLTTQLEAPSAFPGLCIAAIRQELHTSSRCRISSFEATYPVVRLAFQVQTGYLCHLFSSHECHYDPSHLRLLSLHNFLYLPCNSVIPFPLFDFNISFPSTFYKESSISISSFLTFFPLRKNLTYGTAPTPVHRYNSPLPVP